MHDFRLVLAMVVVGTLCARSDARADPFRLRNPEPLHVTGGIFDAPVEPGANGLLVLFGGRGFSFATFVDTADNGAFVPAEQCQTPCAPGTALLLLARLDNLGNAFHATLDGQVYPNINTSRTFGFAAFEGTAVLPDLLGPSAVIAAPFTYDGYFVHGAITQNLFGHGVAGVFLSRAEVTPGMSGWAVDRVTYLIDPSLPPTPEPGTLVLLGTGVAALWWRRRHRPHSPNPDRAADRDVERAGVVQR